MIAASNDSEITERALAVAATSHLVDPERVAEHLQVTADAVVSALFPAVVTETYGGVPRWVLKPSLRRRLLADFDPAANTPLPPPASTTATASETLLRQWLTGAFTDVPQAVAKQPDALRQVAGWLFDGTRLRPPPREVLQRLAVGELRAKYQRTATNAFVGRNDELHRLDALTAAAPWTVIVEATGGMGKSALLAKFLLQHGAFAEGGALAAVIDFDDPGLTPARPDLIYAEIGRQLAIQDVRFDGYAHELRSNAETVDGLGADSGFEAFDTTARDDLSTDSLARALFGRVATVGRPLYLALDTFERPRQTIATALESFVARLQAIVADCRAPATPIALIVAGRGPIVSATLSSVAARTLSLGPLKRKFAAKLLAELGVPAAFIGKILGNFEAAPLTLCLAAQAVAAGATEVLDADAAIQAIRRARGAGFLQLRILEHLPSSRLAEVARRALLLGTITPARLHAIVGPLVSPPIDLDEAERLFDDLAKVTEVVMFAADQRALVLRAEVAADIAELSAVATPSMVVAVRTRAVEVLAASLDARDQDDLLIHRAWLAALAAPGPLVPPAAEATLGAPSRPTLASVRAEFESLATSRRFADALALVADSDVAATDVELLLEALQVADRAGDPVQREQLAESAVLLATSARQRALSTSALAGAITARGIHSDDERRRVEGLRATTRQAWDDGAATEGTVNERAAVLVELAIPDPAWARGELAALYDAHGWTALADASHTLMRHVCALVASRSSLEWAAKLGGFSGAVPGRLQVWSLAHALVEHRIDVGLGDDVGAIERGLERRHTEGGLGETVIGILYALPTATLAVGTGELSAPARPSDDVFRELASLLDQFRGIQSGVGTINLSERGRAHDRLIGELTALDEVHVRELFDLLGDRNISRRATARDVDLAVRGAVNDIARRGRGDDFAKVLDDHGLPGTAALARTALGRKLGDA